MSPAAGAGRGECVNARGHAPPRGREQTPAGGSQCPQEAAVHARAPTHGRSTLSCGVLYCLLLITQYIHSCVRN